MANNITDVSVLKPAVRDYYDRLVVMTAFPELIYSKYAQKRTLPKKSGDTIVFGRFPKFDTVTVPLIDGVTPPGVALTREEFSATVKFYGNFMTYTNQVEMTVEDNTLNQGAMNIGQNFGQSMDELTRDILVSSISVVPCKFGNNGNTPTELTKADIDSMVVTLLSNDAKMITKKISASKNVATQPIRPSFIGFIDATMLDDLEAVTGFKHAVNYSQDSSNPNEWGNTGSVRWDFSSIGKKSSATPAIYSMPIVGQEAYAAVNFTAKTGKLIFKALGSAGTADPLDQRGSIGWHHGYVARVLNDNFMAVLQATHS